MTAPVCPARDAAVTRAAAMIRRHDAHEHGQHLRDQRLVAEQADAQPPRERQRPLPVVGHHRQDVIHQVRRTSRHPPAIARRANSSELAAERDEDLVLTRRAHDTREALLHHAAVEHATEAVLDVTRQPEAMRRPSPRILQHGLEVVSDHLIERRRLWPAAAIATRQRPRRDARAAFEHVLRCVRTGDDPRGCACNATLVRCGDSRRFETLRQDVRAPDARRPHAGRHGSTRTTTSSPSAPKRGRIGCSCRSRPRDQPSPIRSRSDNSLPDPAEPTVARPGSPGPKWLSVQQALVITGAPAEFDSHALPFTFNSLTSAYPRCPSRCSVRQPVRIHARSPEMHRARNGA